MKFRIRVFNIYLLALVCAFALACQTTDQKKKKELSSMSLHREVNPDSTGRSEPVPILREHPIYVNVEKDAFLHEAYFTSASVVEQPGGFAIQIQLNPRGSKLLEIISVSNQGKHFAILGDFGEKRWLAAPLFSRRIIDGTITFTPDASREEAERIVRGLTTTIKENKQRTAVLFSHE
ncbi:MAG TPA: hypothetical protein VFA77_08215 [Candidatus Eisenbacteria bacterium]|jgi:predicted component of type VI protein secretion system|nr:hypothetical protein [Candidatus Eisenbacteria bacterium]